MRVAVENQRAERNPARDRRAAPQQGIEPGLELRKIKGLGQIVIGTGIQSCHPVIKAVQRRQYQHRQLAFGFAQALQHRQAIDHRQPQIEDGNVERLLEQQIFGHSAVCRMFDFETGQP